MRDVSIFLGSAPVPEGDGMDIIKAKGKEEMATARKGLTSSPSIQKLEVVVNASELASCFDPLELSGWMPFLENDANVLIRVVVDEPTAPDLQPVQNSFLLAGLTAGSEKHGSDGSITLTASRQTVNQGTVKSGSLNFENNFLLDLDGDGDLVDEDALLGEEGQGILKAPSSVGERTAGDDCGRLPCDNCTCGRAEREASGKSKPVEKTVPTSSCGNCGKGDAFRCAGCPFLGKPAFKPGEEHLVLDLQDDF